MPPKHPKTDGLGPWTERILPTQLERIRDAEHDVLLRLRELGYGDDCRFAVRLALEEALVNAMKHGNRMDQSRCVHLAYRVLPERVEIHVTDEGDGFDPAKVPDPTADENLAKPSGRGIMLMRCYMDEVAYAGDGRQVYMRRQRRA